MRNIKLTERISIARRPAEYYEDSHGLLYVRKRLRASDDLDA